MSTTIDERVVEMRFDNRQFESNVKTTMSTIERFKQSLNLSGASKGLENVGHAASKMNFSGIGAGIDTIVTKFSALDVMGVTALANITNAAVNAGKKMVSALTIDPIKTGFSEYETKINSIQTIMSNTASKGTTMADVTKVIDELNTYADKTIYNFSEMTRNIGTFTAAGVGLEESAAAIQGIANLAAASGSNSQQASTAMYQLSQALAAGTVKLMDWNSVVNAGMGGEKFQEALKATARDHGVAVDALIEQNGSFRDSLQEGWITADILNETLNKFTTKGAKEYGDAMVKAGKWTQEQADALLKEAKSMEDAATKVKTFTQLWDTLKESVQSGWGKTWELIFGDYEQASELFSGISDALSGFVNKMSDFRNGLIEGAMGSPFGELAKKIESVTGVTETMSTAMKDYGEIVDKVIGGEFGNGRARWDKLTEAGYDWAKVQNLVNEKLGDSTRHTEQAAESQEKLAESQKVTTEELVKMSDAQLKSLGFTEKEVKAFRELEEQSKKTGIPINDLIKDMDQLSGRTLLINSFKNMGQSLVTVLKAVKDAWVEIFPPATSEQLYNAIAGFHKFSTYLVVGEDTADKLKRTLKGVFAIIDILATVTGGALKVAFKLVCEVLKLFDTDILSVTANIGDAIVKFRDFVDSTLDFSKAFEVIGPYIKKAADAIKDWIESLKGSDNIARDIVLGLANGLREGVKLAVTAIIELGKRVLEAIKNVLGIHSPSTEFFEIGKNIIEGLVNGIKAGFSAVSNTLKELATGCLKVLGKVDWGAILAVGIGAGALVTMYRLASALESLASPLDGIGDVLERFAGVLKSTSKVMNAFALNLKAKALFTIATSIAVLVASIALLTFLDQGKLWGAIAMIAALAAVLGVLTAAIGKWGPKEAVQLGKFSLALVGVSTSLLLMATALKMISGIENLEKGLVAITTMSAIFVGLIAATKLFNKDAEKVGGTLLKMSASMILMVQIIKMVSGLDNASIERGRNVILSFSGIFVGLIAATRLFGNEADKVGGTLLKMSAAMLLIIGIAKLAAGMNVNDLAKGGLIVTAFGLILVGLIAATKLVGKDLKKIGNTLLAMATAIGILALVIRLIGGMGVGELLKGVAVVTALGLLIAGLVAATKYAGKDLKGVGTTMLLISLSIAILAGVVALLGLMKIGNLTKGIIAVGLLSAMMAGLIIATGKAKDCKGNLIVITVAIGLLAVAVAALSFIDTKKLIASSAALGLVMGMFALIIYSSGLAGSSIKPIITMTVAVGLLGGMLYLLAKLDAGSCLSTAASISVLLLSISASLLILKTVSGISPMALVAIAAMTLIVGALGGILYLLKDMPVESTLANATALSGLLLAMSGVCAILTLVGAGGPAAFIGIGALITLIGGVGAFITAIGALVTKFPQLEEFLNVGIPIIEKIGHALGSFFGNIVGGFAEGVTSGLPAIGQNLSDFMSNASVFIEGAKTVDGSVLTGIGVLSGAIMALTAADFISGIASFISGGSSFAVLGADLSAFMRNASGFLAGAATIDPAIAEGAKAIASTILALTAADLISNITSFISGGSTLADFATQLVPFGDALAAFSATVAGRVNEEAVLAAANAGKMLTEMAATIPNSGGLLGAFLGENDMSTFGSQLTNFGLSIVAFSRIVEGNVNEEAITAAMNAGKMMTEMATSLPNTGGLVSYLTGDNDMGTFGTQLVAFGHAIVSFSTIVGSGAVNETAVTAAATAGKMMAEMAATIPNSGGLVTYFTGDNDMATFGTQLVAFGQAMVLYSNTISGINPEAITASVTAAQGIVALANALPESGGLFSIFSADNDMSTFGNELVSFGRSIKEYSLAVTGIDSEAMSGAVSAANQVVNLINSMASIDTSGVESFKNALNSLGETSVDKFIQAFEGKTTSLVTVGSNLIDSVVTGVKSRQVLLTSTVTSLAESIRKTFTSKNALMKTAGMTLMTAFITGIKSQNGKVKSAAKANATDGIADIRNTYDSWYSAGSYLVDGLAQGILDNKSAAINAAIEVAIAALEAAEEELEIESPSKAFYRVGDFAGQGLVNALSDYQSKTYTAGADIAKSAKEGLKNAISKIQDTISGDMDMQPTISPVLDLSDIKNRAATIGDLLNGNTSIGLMSNIGAVATMMNNRQNGDGEVVSAINKLRKELGNVGGTTYQLNGITYDDGSNVSNAVKDLVRAAKIERRI